MRNHWATRAIACALIATLPATLVAQTQAGAAAPASTTTTTSTDETVGAWGVYARLVGQNMKDTSPSGGFRLQWRWETPGQVLLEEWFGGAADVSKPSHVMTIRLGGQPGTLILKSSSMMGKEWVGTLQDDGSISFVGKGLLKMPYSVRIDEQGHYEQADTRGHTYEYAPITASEPSVITENASVPGMKPASTPATTAPQTTPPATIVTGPGPVATEAPVPVVAKQSTLPPPPPIRKPRRLSDADLQRLRLSVQSSRARAIEEARQAELRSQEATLQLQRQIQAMQQAEAQRQLEEAEADAEFEAERARKAASWNESKQANEQALADSLQRMRDSTARIQAQQADAAARQRAQADALAAADRQRQVELIRQANQRQDEEAARLAAQRQEYERARATAQQRSTADSAAASHASTDTDANRCVTQSEVRENDTFKGNTAAYVVNGCGTPVDVRICLMAESGWKCGMTTGLASQASWSFSTFQATGRVFVDAKTAGSNRRLASPN